MTPAAIREGFSRLRSGNDMKGLADAAVCRSEADWLIGINGTRAMTAFNSKTGGFHLTTVGRVQTPTLAIVVEREERIRKFQARDYWEVEAEFGVASGDYLGRWFDEKFKKSEDDEHGKAERIWDHAKAQAIRAKCQGKPGIVTEESKPSTQASPLLFDLTSLQREANGRFGFSAKTTLSLAQALYEKHKVLTYPRTDSRALPEDYLGTVKNTLEQYCDSDYGPIARRILDAGWVKPNKRIFNNAKVSDHFAIIPTGTQPKNLSELEQKLYDFVVKRFLAIFHPAAEYLVTTRITRVEGEAFKTEGKVLVNPGWLAVYGKEAQDEDSAGSLVPVKSGEQAKNETINVKPHATKPPPRFNEGTLLSAMEGAGKFVDDDELREAMAARGLGTPATRAAIIEGLLTEKYLLREGKDLIPMAKAFSLITLLKGLGVEELSKPELTGEWEHKLARIERGDLTRPVFMQEIAAMADRIVSHAKSHESDTVPGDFATLGVPCPKCGSVIKENYKKFQCQGCDYALWKIVAGRQFEIPEIETLLNSGEVGPLLGFRNKMGRSFDAKIKLNDDKQPEFDFGQPKDDGSAEPIDFSEQTSLGPCPKCSAPVYEHGNAYVCQKSVGPDKTCDFRSGKLILQQGIERAQMEKLLNEGRTELLRGFISARTKRKFSAFLVRQADGKVGFEFEAKDPAAKKTGGRKKKEAAEPAKS